MFLSSVILTKISDYIDERNRVSMVTFAKGEEPELPPQTVEDYTARIERARADFRALDVAMAKANLENTVVWDGRETLLMKAIQLAKELRKAVAEFKALASRRKTERAALPSSRYGGDVIVKGTAVELIVQTTYDPEEMRRRAEKLERQVNRLFRDIERKNDEVTIDFAAAERYMV